MISNSYAHFLWESQKEGDYLETYWDWNSQKIKIVLKNQGKGENAKQMEITIKSEIFISAKNNGRRI